MSEVNEWPAQVTSLSMSGNIETVILGDLFLAFMTYFKYSAEESMWPRRLELDSSEVCSVCSIRLVEPVVARCWVCRLEYN